MLHKYKYFVVYEEIDNSLRSLNNDSSIVHIKMKNIISKGIKRSMEVDFYKLMDFKYKQKKDMPEAWNIIIGDVDKFLVDFLKNFGIDMDLLYTTNVGVLNISSQNESSILWDVSYWAIYIKYLEFVFWMENEPGFSSKQTLQPLAMKKNVFQNRDKADANRLVFLCSIFQYISYKFYNEEELEEKVGNFMQDIEKSGLIDYFLSKAKENKENECVRGILGEGFYVFISDDSILDKLIENSEEYGLEPYVITKLIDNVKDMTLLKKYAQNYKDYDGLNVIDAGNLLERIGDARIYKRMDRKLERRQKNK